MTLTGYADADDVSGHIATHRDTSFLHISLVLSCEKRQHAAFTQFADEREI